ncbi:MAG: cytochrome c biogenesis CcdA family protein [Candidatus Pacearchaeota archaeon]
MKHKNMQKIALFVIFLTLFFISINSIKAQDLTEKNQKNIYFFWGKGCPHCENVINSGVLEEVSEIENVNVYSFEVYYNQSNRDLYNKFANELEINQYQRGIPFLVIECEKGYSYFIGDTPIINNLKNSITHCKPMKEISSRVSSDNLNIHKITLGSIIIAALIDSINPCAFGVLIFLLATMLSTASSKRALKYGLIYVFIIFIVYFLAGLGIMKIISEFSEIMNYIIVIAGVLVFIGGLIEIKDFFFYGKGFSLKIPVSVKPILEKITKKGTLWAIILLGIVVALVELPCTGGIYLAILSLMHINKSFGIPYLLLYNIIFVFPLIIIVLIAYHGTKTEKITNWIDKNKKWMRLAAGLTMIILAIYLLNSVYNWI